MAIDPFDGNHVFAIDNGVLLESHNSCDTTETFATAPNTSINSIAFDLNEPDILYAGTDEGAYISFDSGESWNQINDGLTDSLVVYSIAVDKDGNVYASTPYGIYQLDSR
jgi:ligand-binding sensor domain-containing protein